MEKNLNSKYIEKSDFENPLKKSSLVSMLSHNIIIESFIQLIIWRCMKSIFVDYGLLHVFWYFLKNPLYYDNSKNIQKNHTMWL